MASVTNWLLSVELDGEWEECSFATRQEAIKAFVALAADYSRALTGAVLTAIEWRDPTLLDQSGRPAKKVYMN